MDHICHGLRQKGRLCVSMLALSNTWPWYLVHLDVLLTSHGLSCSTRRDNLFSNLIDVLRELSTDDWATQTFTVIGQFFLSKVLKARMAVERLLKYFCGWWLGHIRLGISEVRFLRVKFDRTWLSHLLLYLWLGSSRPAVEWEGLCDSDWVILFFWSELLFLIFSHKCIGFYFRGLKLYYLI